MQVATGALYCVESASVRTDGAVRRGQETVALGRNVSSDGFYGYLKFAKPEGLEKVPKNAVVLSASLHFRPTDNYSDNGFGYRYFACDGAWDAGSISWANRPKDETVACAGAIYGRTWHSIDIKAIAQAWLTDERYSFENGLFVRANTENRYSYKLIGGAGHASFRPYIEMVYEIPASVPKMDKSTCKMGETVRVALETAEENAAHRVEFFAGGGEEACYTAELAAGEVEIVWEIPQDEEFGKRFGTEREISLVVRVTTYVDGEERGSAETQAVLGLPEDAAPEVVCTPLRTGQEVVEAFVQRKSGVLFAVEGRAKYGATVASAEVEFEGVTVEGIPETGANETGAVNETEEENEAGAADGIGEEKIGSVKSTAAFERINGKGTIVYRAKVTDSRGNTGVLEGTVEVLPWEEPKIDYFSATRVNEVGVPDISGRNVRAGAGMQAVSLDVDGEKNRLTVQVFWRKSKEEAWQATDIFEPESLLEAVSYTLTSNGEAVDFNDLEGYSFKLVTQDLFAEAEAFGEIPTKDVFLHLKRSARSIGIGMETTGTAEKPAVDVAQDVHIRGGLEVDGGIVGAGVAYSTDEQTTGDTWIDGKPIYRRVITNTITGGGSKVIGNAGTEVESVTKMYGLFKYGNDNWRPLPTGYYGGINYMTGFLYEIETGDIRVQFGSQINGTSNIVIVMEYTKAQ